MPYGRLCVAALLGFPLWSQTTEGLITGRTSDRTTGRQLAGVSITLTRLPSGTVRSATTDSRGFYEFAQTSPGQYQVAANVKGYQTREVDEIRLDVAGFLQLDFDLRPLTDVWERGRYRSHVFQKNTVLNYFGPDLDPAYSGNFEPERSSMEQLEPSVSDVFDQRTIDALPLSGRDVYSSIVLLPGVAADTTTVRSIGVSVNGQRPTSSNFLLDGVDNNNQVLTGPAVLLAPEAIEEYRVSTNNFSAEYGSVTGYIANAVTRGASSAWHASLYEDLTNAVLDANSFNRNAQSLPRVPYGSNEPGFWAGGPLPWKGWSLSSAFDYFHTHSNQSPVTLYLPTTAFYQSLPVGSLARRILTDYPPAFWSSAPGDTGPVTAVPPFELTRYSLMERVEWAPSEKQHLLGRISASRLTNPDFIWTAYGQSPLRQDTIGMALVSNSVWQESFTTELRVGVHTDRLGWDLANSSLPVLQITSEPIQLPGSCCNIGYGDRSHTASVEGGSVWMAGRNILKAGGGWLRTPGEDRFEYEPHGVFTFADVSAFASDTPEQFEEAISRTDALNGTFAPASLSTRYAYQRVYAYAQDDLRLTPGLTLNAGLRGEYFGAPSFSSGTPATVLNLPPNTLPATGIADASLGVSTRPFSMKPMTWDGRFGLAYSPKFARRAFVLRAGYGLFHEGLYENLWSEAAANDGVIAVFAGGPNTGCATVMSGQCLAGYSDFLNLTAFASPLKVPSVQSFYLSLQARPSSGWTVEVNGLGSSGRHLISTDIINRFEEFNRPNPYLNGDVSYRSNDAQSNYAALTLSTRYQASRGGLQASYTWSHSIDNQSDPLLGDFLDLGFSNQTNRVGKTYYGAFTLPSDPDSDRGNSDFDQRQNLVMFSYWELPHLRGRRNSVLTRNWRVSQTFALRSGLPYSVYAGTQNCHPICNTRADLIDPATIYVSGATVPGGKQVLNPAAFTAPPDGTNGNTGRNAFTGPGFWNLDVSLSRIFPAPRISEAARLTLRADAFNVLNHANLQPPVAYWGTSPEYPNPSFGQALYGRTQKQGFPALTPLLENARQVQLLLRLEF